MPSLHILFVRADNESSKDLAPHRRTLDWNAAKSTQQNDIGLIYVSGEGERRLKAVARAAEEASPGVPRQTWTKSKRGYFAKWKDLTLLDRPILLDDIRQQFPKWARWEALRGVRSHTVPEQYRGPLARWVVAENPTAGKLLAPFLVGGESLAEPDDARYEGATVRVSHLRYERDRDLRLRAIASAPRPLACSVCRFDFAAFYGPAGQDFIEVHHKVPVSSGRRKGRIKDLALLCSNCHTMAHLRSGKKPRPIQQLIGLAKRYGVRA